MSEKKFIPVSHSRLDAYETCPKRFFHETIEKSIPFQESAAMREGTRVHQVLSARVAVHTPLPPGDRYMEPMCQQIIAAPGETFTDVKIGLTQQLKPCGYKDWDNCFIRLEYDVMKLNDRRMWIGDYKSGQPTNDTKQLKLYAASGFELYPHIDKVTTSYIWLKLGKLDPSDTRSYERNQRDELWSEFLARAERLQQAWKAGTFEPRGGRHCKWCKVNQRGWCKSATEPYRGN